MSNPIQSTPLHTPFTCTTPEDEAPPPPVCRTPDDDRRAHAERATSRGPTSPPPTPTARPHASRHEPDVTVDHAPEEMGFLERVHDALQYGRREGARTVESTLQPFARLATEARTEYREAAQHARDRGDGLTMFAATMLESVVAPFSEGHLGNTLVSASLNAAEATAATATHGLSSTVLGVLERSPELLALGEVEDAAHGLEEVAHTGRSFTALGVTATPQAMRTVAHGLTALSAGAAVVHTGMDALHDADDL